MDKISFDMWKDSYRLGVERLDQQHRALFLCTEGLLRDIIGVAGPARYKETITFLKRYVVEHFQDEEVYQQAIGYAGLDKHRIQHQRFTESVLRYEKRLIASAWDLRVVKELVGMLSAWLIYHVADADQKIAESLRASMNCFTGCAVQVLNKMVGLEQSDIQVESQPDMAARRVLVEVKLYGQRPGFALFGFDEAFPFNMLNNMLGVELSEVDEMVTAALCELSNIICGNAATELTEKGIPYDIGVPSLVQVPGDLSMLDGACISTELGNINIWLSQAGATR